MSSGERVGWLFLTVPLAVYIAARLVTHFFYNRYRYALVSPPWPLSKYAAALHFTSFQEIVANARSTALINPTPEFAEALERAGLHLKIRFAKPLYVVYLE